MRLTSELTQGNMNQNTPEFFGSQMKRGFTMQALYEAYRPKQWSDVIGQPKAIAKLDRFRKRRGTLAGDCYFLSGSSGTGKTSIALLIAEETSDPWTLTEFDDPSELTADVLRKLAEQRQIRPFGKGYCNVVNEIHGARSEQIRKLLGLTERLPEWVTWIFTSSRSGEERLLDGTDDMAPWLSRCKRIPMARRGLSEPFAQRAMEIAQAEGLDGQPIEAYTALLKRCRNNLRLAIQEIEGGAMLATN